MIDEDDARDMVGGDGDQDRRLRREIANSNERRRMQSINAGFQSLRTLLPHHEGEKLSKAAILQQTAEYIYQLEQEKTRLLSQNSQLKRLYSLSQQGLTTSPASTTPGNADDTTSPRLKKKRIIATTTSLEKTTELINSSSKSTDESSTEIFTTSSTSNSTTSMSELSLQLMNEQRLRMRLEERLKTLEQASKITVSNPKPVTNTVTPVLPTQPIKMEFVNSEAASAAVSARLSGPTGPPATILLADKNGIRVEVEALPQQPVSIQPATVAVQPVVAASSETVLTAGVGVAGGAPQAAAKNPSAEELRNSNVTKGSTTSVGSIPNSKSSQRSFIVTTGSGVGVAGNAGANRQNLDSIVEAIRHLEGDHLFSEDSHKVVNEEVVEYSSTPTATATVVQAQPAATNLSHHHVTVTKNLVPSKVVGLKSVVQSSNPIPATLLPKQPHPPSAVLHQQSKGNNSIIIVKSCQT